MIDIGKRRECFFDSFLIDENKTTAERRLHKPTRKNIVFKLDKPKTGVCLVKSGNWSRYDGHLGKRN